MAYLCSGNTRAKPSARSMASAMPGGTLLGSMSLGKASAAGMMCVPMPSWRAVSIAIAVSSPVTILTRTPFSFAISIVALESSRGGSNIGNMPSSDQLCPASSERATPSAREPLAASSSTVVLTRWATSAGGLARSTMTCGAPLLTYAFALGIGDRRGGALAYGIEGHEFHLLVGLERRLILQRRDHRGVNGVAILDLRSQGSGQDAILRAFGGKQDWIAERELVLGQGPGLVRAQNVDPRHFLDGGQLGDDRPLFRQRQRAQCHGDGEHRRHRHRDRCDEQNEDELQDAERVFESPVVGDDDVLIDLDGDHDQRQRDGDDDQEVPDLEHRPLGVADGAGAGHELGGAADEGVGAGGDDNALHLD